MGGRFDNQRLQGLTFYHWELHSGSNYKGNQLCYTSCPGNGRLSVKMKTEVDLRLKLEVANFFKVTHVRYDSSHVTNMCTTLCDVTPDITSYVLILSSMKVVQI